MNTVGPSFTLICWSIALIGLVALVLLAIRRWAQGKAIASMHRAGLLVCVLTLIWVWPGILAGAVLLGLMVAIQARMRHRPTA